MDARRLGSQSCLGCSAAARPRRAAGRPRQERCDEGSERLLRGVLQQRPGDETLSAHIEHGNSTAQFLFGLRLKDGQGVPPDLIEAYMWIDIAASTSARDRLQMVTSARE